jgi:transcriptional antiterminator
LLHVEVNLNTSTLEIAQHLQVSQQTVQRILKKHKIFPYILRKICALFGNDPQRRTEFCAYFISKLKEDAIFYHRLLWSDECTFGKKGVVNLNNHRHCSWGNNHVVVEQNFKR